MPNKNIVFMARIMACPSKVTAGVIKVTMFMGHCKRVKIISRVELLSVTRN